jgi:hypothetical protein
MGTARAGTNLFSTGFPENGDRPVKTFVSAVAVFLSATTFSFAQSLPNYGPNAPAQGDSYGKPYSGARPLHFRAYRRAYAYQRRAHYRAHHHWPHWYD